MAELVIRLAEDGDRDALIEQFQALNQHEDALTGNRRSDRAGGEEALLAAEVAVRETGGMMFVAERYGRVVGHMCLTFEQAPIYVRPEWRPYVYVKELFLREEARGIGLGQKLLQHAEGVARQRGYRQLLLSVVATNAIALRAYERFGFQPYSVDLIKPLD